MQKKHQNLEKLFPREFIQNSEFAFQNFKKKGYRVLPKLKIELVVLGFESLNEKIESKMRLVKIFKRTKFVRSLDLSQLTFWRWKFYFSAILYISKKMSKTLSLSVKDHRMRSHYYEGFAKVWPKYMKNLASLTYKPVIEQPNAFTEKLNLGEMPKEIKLMTDFLSYFKRLENFKIDGSSGFSDYLNRLWRFENYPTSIKKLSLSKIDYTNGIPNASLAHLKQLKDLKFNLSRFSLADLSKPVISLLSQVDQIEALTLNFGREFEIDPSVCKILKSLTRLKKVKFEVYMKKEKNLQILDSLVECPLKDLSLKVSILSCEGTSLISDFLEKKKDLISLKLDLDFEDINENDSNIKRLIQLIDSLDSLISLRLSARFSQMLKDLHQSFSCLPWCQPQTSKEIEIAFRFSHILSKPTPLRKFRVAFNQPDVTKDYFFELLDLLHRASPTLEKLEMNFEGYKPQDETEAEKIVTFIRNLKSVRSLKLMNLNIQFVKIFSDLIETINTLKFLKTLQIGDISGEVSKQLFLDGIGKLLSKYGLRRFYCESSLDFGKDNSNYEGLQLINLREVFDKNPFLIKIPSMFIYQSSLSV